MSHVELTVGLSTVRIEPNIEELAPRPVYMSRDYYLRDLGEAVAGVMNAIGIDGNRAYLVQQLIGLEDIDEAMAEYHEMNGVAVGEG